MTNDEKKLSRACVLVGGFLLMACDQHREVAHVSPCAREEQTLLAPQKSFFSHSQIRVVNMEGPTAPGLRQIQVVRIENLRTCSFVEVDAASDDSVHDEMELSNGQILRDGPLITKAGQSGLLKLVVTNSPTDPNRNALWVTDGSNPIRITYFDDRGRSVAAKELILDFPFDPL